MMMTRSYPLTKPIDNMANAVEISSVDNLVKDSEIVNYKDMQRRFEYTMDEKAAKAKMVKNAEKIPFEIIENSSSSNLVFSPGSWNSVVQPSMRYWDEVKGTKTCEINDTIVKIADVKTSKDVGCKHIDTQIVLFSNRVKVVIALLQYDPTDSCQWAWLC